MSEFEERTIPVPLDNLDFEAPALGGLTYKELIITIACSFFLSLTISIPFAAYILGNFLFGFLISILFTAIFTYKFMKRAYILKKDRPSYMIWIAMQKKIQNEGIFGIKIPLGFIETTHWHTGTKKKW